MSNTAAEPTAGALRAASRVAFLGNFQVPINEHTATEIASIIERETGLRELIAACKAALVEIEWWRNEHGCCDGHEIETMAIIEAALAAASIKPEGT